MAKPTPTHTPNQPPQASDSGRLGLEAAFNEEAEDGLDERVIRRAGGDERGDRGISEDVARTQHDGLLSDDDYERLVRSEFEQTALPQPPVLPGWHLCWLTTTSQYDSIAKRQRIGYRPVKRSEMPGFDPSNGADLVKYEGFVTCNEMVLHKLPEPYYQKMMEYFHHTRPNQDAQGTLQKIKDGLTQEQDSSGKDLGETIGSGYLDMEQTAKRATGRPPRFAA